MSWFAQFDDPIELPDGRKLLTLRDAAEYLTKSSEGRARNTRVADSYGSADPGRRERRPDDVAADRLLKALNRHLVRQFDPNRKGPRKPGSMTARYTVIRWVAKSLHGTIPSELV